MGLKLVTDLERELSDAAMLVYVTNSEGLGSGALLAMSAGVPVIASNVGGLPEVIRHGENGLLVANDADAIRRAIELALNDPTRSEEIAGMRINLAAAMAQGKPSGGRNELPGQPIPVH
jgi:glycosyltransferase involved in cell wall biosynthesis